MYTQIYLSSVLEDTGSRKRTKNGLQTQGTMPELPEVNTFQKYFNGSALGRQIERVVVHDDKIFRNISGEAFIERLTGLTFVGSYRRGKYLFGELDNGHHVLFHFGMTGDLNYYSEDEDRGKYERFVFYFNNGFRLGFDCQRKFARICYIEDLEAYLQELALGEDALSISETGFLQQMEGKKGTLKGFLLNQTNLAGVGNLYADEICYRTRIHPASQVNKLSKNTVRKVYEAMREVLQYAVDRDAYYKAYPADWLWQWRSEGSTGPDGESIVKKMKVAGRTTYYCAGWQQQY